MKNVKPIVLAVTLVLAVSAPAFAKGGTISGTKTGTISGTRTGTISGTRTGTISGTRTGTISGTRTGTISGTRMGTISATGDRTNVAVTSDQSWFVELLFTVLARW